MIEQNMDYRFNKNLQVACKEDITKFCSDVIGIESIFKLGRQYLQTQTIVNNLLS